jgi:GNAT superfamily N-acetyltransferase
MSETFLKAQGDQITDEILEACADLFSDHYGVWAPNAASVSRFPKPGSRVKMNSEKLRAQSVSDAERSIVALCYVDDKLRGHVFATVWNSESDLVGWITQLVVHKDFRRRGIATRLMETLKSHRLLANVSIVGLASSHPATCSVLAKYAGTRVDLLDLSFIKQNAAKVIQNSPVEYVKTAQLHGSLFEDDSSSGAVSSVDTRFYVDHEEPLAALKEFKSRGPWLLGDLPDGHEFLIMAPVPPKTIIPGQ